MSEKWQTAHVPTPPRLDRRVIEALADLAFAHLLPEDLPTGDQIDELLSTAITAAYYAGHYHGQNGEPIPHDALPDVSDLFEWMYLSPSTSTGDNLSRSCLPGEAHLSTLLSFSPSPRRTDEITSWPFLPQRKVEAILVVHERNFETPFYLASLEMGCDYQRNGKQRQGITTFARSG